MGAHDGTQHIQGIVHPISPLPHTFVDGILQRLCSGGDGMNRCAQKLHAVYVQRLPLRILFPHENLTVHVQKRGGGSRGHAVLSCACFRNDAGLPHLFRQKRLSQHIVDLVGTGVIQVFSFQINLRSA